MTLNLVMTLYSYTPLCQSYTCHTFVFLVYCYCSHHYALAPSSYMLISCLLLNYDHIAMVKSVIYSI
jgi:hypothetical protein